MNIKNTFIFLSLFAGICQAYTPKERPVTCELRCGKVHTEHPLTVFNTSDEPLEVILNNCDHAEQKYTVASKGVQTLMIPLDKHGNIGVKAGNFTHFAYNLPVAVYYDRHTECLYFIDTIQDFITQPHHASARIAFAKYLEKLKQPKE